MIPRKTLSVKRFAAGSYNTDGDWVEGADSDFNISASVQPLTGREMEMLPEARRDSQSYKLYSDTQLLTADTSQTKNADIVTIDNEKFEVFSDEPWQNNIINHHKITVIKI